MNNGSTPIHTLHDNALPAGTLRVLQITDMHLCADDDAKLLGVNTYESFRSVIDEFLSLGWHPDLILATGDLVHDASAESYRKLLELLDQFDCPVACLPGNHDDPKLMRECLRSDLVSCPRILDKGAWRIVLLDSVMPGEVGGRLSETELDILDDAIHDCDRPILITTHHHPIPINSAWIDQIGIENGQELVQMAEQYEQVKGLLWGHVHQAFDQQRGHVRLLASPSTCVQFAPESEDFLIDEKQPGFRLLALQPDGSIRTTVLRTPTMPAGLNVASGGY